DPRLIEEMGVVTCLRAGAVPMRRLGGATVIATCRPDQFAELAQNLPHSFGRPIMAIAPERPLHDALLTSRDRRLVEKAETRLPEQDSCRVWYGQRPRRVLALLLGALALGAVVAPVPVLGALTLLALLTMFATTVLKAASAMVARPSHPARDTT
ncbi:glycosyl transferase, partial [Escherichia coli]|nr:glycosyl transferase [Escherichia coli]